MSISKGLQFKKFDLHVHTPASPDFKDKKVTPENIVDAALKNRLAGIAITDHQTGAWVDDVKKAAKRKNLVIFPGVEILATGGKKGVHVLAIFDVDKDSEHIEQLLSSIKIYKKAGKKTPATELSVGQIADKLEEYDSSAILILAHCHSSKGVTGDIAGEVRKQIFKERRKCLLGAEARKSDFVSKTKAKDHKRIIDCFDGTDSNFYKRKLGVYQSSDAHSLKEIGSSFTYFKVDEPITIEDIRQSLIERDIRIRQSFEYKKIVYPRINSLKITSGFLADQEFEFHEGLNSILGAKGSGKSLAIEFLRFALNQQPKDEDILIDHNSKLEKCLRPYGEVEVKFIDASGKEYFLKRTYDPLAGNPIEILDLSDLSEKDFQIEQVFPVLFLSQNEVIKIAEGEGDKQREFIDSFFDFYKYQQEIKRLTKELKETDNSFVNSLKAHLSLEELKKRIETRKEEIDKIGRQIKNKVFNEYLKKEKIGRAIETQLEFIDSLKESLTNTEERYKDLTSPVVEDEETSSEPAVKRVVDKTDKIVKEVKDRIRESISWLEEQKKEIDQEYKDWKKNFEPIKTQYEKLIKEAGGNQIVLNQRRGQLIKELSKPSKELAMNQGKAQQMEFIAKKRNGIIENLNKIYKDYFVERKSRCDHFTENSLGILRVIIEEKKDRTSFRNNLISLKRGSWLKDEEIEAISNNIAPKEFVDNLLRYEWLARRDKKPLEYIAKGTGLELGNVEKLAQYLLDQYEYEEILSLIYTSAPDDAPSISYKVGSNFKKLSELSVGQKAGALLIIALSDGEFPIIIDQPEDSLDLKTIWQNLCQKLRDSKEKRQFIFTTHSSAVAVASDTDKFTILEAGVSSGKVLYSGSMNRPDIKKEVIDYLEGGEPAYTKKRRKYNL